MLRFDKAMYLSFLCKPISSVKLSIVYKVKCFTNFRIHKFSIHFCIIPLLSSLYCYITS